MRRQLKQAAIVSAVLMATPELWACEDFSSPVQQPLPVDLQPYAPGGPAPAFAISEATQQNLAGFGIAGGLLAASLVLAKRKRS